MIAPALTTPAVMDASACSSGIGEARMHVLSVSQVVAKSHTHYRTAAVYAKPSSALLAADAVTARQ
jgi:hypothetical protein